jgi:hypothetical protein
MVTGIMVMIGIAMTGIEARGITTGMTAATAGTDECTPLPLVVAFSESSRTTVLLPEAVAPRSTIRLRHFLDQH